MLLSWNVLPLAMNVFQLILGPLKSSPILLLSAASNDKDPLAAMMFRNAKATYSDIEDQPSFSNFLREKELVVAWIKSA